MGELPTGGAWWRGQVPNVIGEPGLIVGALAQRAAQRGLEVTPQTERSWRETARFVSQSLAEARGRKPEVANWGVLFEYEIPRRAVRPDVVLLAAGVVIVIEVKVGSARFERAHRMQAEEYCRDLADFHEESDGLTIVPVLLASEATLGDVDLSLAPSELLDRAQLATPEVLGGLLVKISDSYGNGAQIDSESWNDSRYRPTPSILEAARAVYEGQDVAAIKHAYADNLDLTVEVVRRTIRTAEREGRRVLCFVTGVPGSGKTLAGLSAVHEGATGSDGQPLGTYLSGNGPLVEVLRYAIATDLSKRTGLAVKDARRKASVFIQPVHRFIGELHGSNEPPPEHVIVFDEAQRAWDAEGMARFNNIDGSEASAAISIMARVPGWAVIVALVGEGQEINRSEAGISAWIEAANRDSQWDVVVPPELVQLTSGVRGQVTVEAGLHLSVGVRSPRARAMADWADAVLRGEFAKARSLIHGSTGFPLLLTRELETMRAYLRDRAREDRRTGLLASAQARRLRAFGIEMDGSFQGGVNWPRWFVDAATDIRSSYSLEIAASEFKCQGLELDWVGLCWGCDLLWDGTNWKPRKLRGSKWQRDSDPTHAINRYRVLLTRARLGMVIWVPKPTSNVPLVDGDGLDRVELALVEAGVVPL